MLLFPSPQAIGYYIASGVYSGLPVLCVLTSSSLELVLFPFHGAEKCSLVNALCVSLPAVDAHCPYFPSAVLLLVHLAAPPNVTFAYCDKHPVVLEKKRLHDRLFMNKAEKLLWENKKLQQDLEAERQERRNEVATLNRGKKVLEEKLEAMEKKMEIQTGSGHGHSW